MPKPPTTYPRAACHVVGAPCLVAIHGLKKRWLAAEVVCVSPLTAKVTAADDVWHGTLVTRSDAHIRVDRVWQSAAKEVLS